MSHQALLPGGVSTALFWLIGAGLVLLSLQLRRFSAARQITATALVHRRATAPRDLVAGP